MGWQAQLLAMIDGLGDDERFAFILHSGQGNPSSTSSVFRMIHAQSHQLIFLLESGK